MEKQPDITFEVIKCEEGLYVSKRHREYHHLIYFTNERFNQKENVVLSTWKDNWYLLKGEFEISSYQVRKTGDKVNFRWELIDKEDNQLKLPEVISLEESFEYCSDYDYYIGTECLYYKYRSLYKRTFDCLPDYWVDVEFNVSMNGVVSVSDVDNYQTMKVSLHGETKLYGDSEQLNVDLSNIVKYSDIEEMLTPPLAIHNRPCELTSKQTYRLIRHYVKENINHNYGVITSDYDFCFTVKKRIPIKPYVISTEIKRDNGKSYRPPRFKHHEEKYKTWDLFEMTNAEDRYKGYTVIQGFKGDSLSDLYNNIKTFLDDLMNHINAPLIECEHCNGYGHIKEEIKKEKK